MTNRSEILRQIFDGTLRKVDVGAAVMRAMQVDASALTIAGYCCELTKVDRVLLIAVGKAGASMYEAAYRAVLEGACGLIVDGAVVAPYAPRKSAAGMRFFRGAHPTPDETSMAAAEAIIEKLREVDERTAVIFLMSGGASSMMEFPLDAGITVEETAIFHQALVTSGLPIAEMNVVRKHFSAVKGGRLAALAQRAAACYTLIVSDVPAGMPEMVGSGPSLPDGSSVDEAIEIFGRLRRIASLPESVVEFFQGAALTETPKPGDGVFERSAYQEILSNKDLLNAAASVAMELGFHVEVDTSCDDWEYREAGRYLLDRFAELRSRYAKVCLISGGELSVRVGAECGVGGRNQQFALWCAEELARSRASVSILSAGSDGIDGNSPAAGAVADETTVERALTLGMSASESLEAFDAYRIFDALGDAVVTGVTGNNLRDLRILI
jgi:hydroxypyruvate reductase